MAMNSSEVMVEPLWQPAWLVLLGLAWLQLVVGLLPCARACCHWISISKSMAAEILGETFPGMCSDSTSELLDVVSELEYSSDFTTGGCQVGHSEDWTSMSLVLAANLWVELSTAEWARRASASARTRSHCDMWVRTEFSLMPHEPAAIRSS